MMEIFSFLFKWGSLVGGRFAVTAKNDAENRKALHVILEKDIIDIEAGGAVRINGVDHKALDDRRILVRDGHKVTVEHIRLALP